MLDILIELGVRFIFVEGHATDDVCQMAQDKVKRSEGRGLSVKWVQQYAVLAHKVNLANICSTYLIDLITFQAVGSFVSHAGSNSAMESIRMKVPMSASLPEFEVTSSY